MKKSMEHHESSFIMVEKNHILKYLHDVCAKTIPTCRGAKKKGEITQSTAMTKYSPLFDNYLNVQCILYTRYTILNGT